MLVSARRYRAKTPKEVSRDVLVDPAPGDPRGLRGRRPRLDVCSRAGTRPASARQEAPQRSSVGQARLGPPADSLARRGPGVWKDAPVDDPASPITAVPVGVFRPERFEAVLPKDSFETFMGAVTQAANVFAGRV